jgi:hypothetical protein
VFENRVRALALQRTQEPVPDKVLELLAEYDRRNTGSAGRDAQQQEVLGVQSPPKVLSKKQYAPLDTTAVLPAPDATAPRPPGARLAVAAAAVL